MDNNTPNQPNAQEPTLTDIRHVKFVAGIVAGKKRYQAAIDANYSPKSARSIATRLLKKAEIIAAIEKAKRDVLKHACLDKSWIIARLMSVTDRCMQAEQVTDKRGNVIEGEYQFDSMGANKSLELLAKHLKMLTDVQEVQGLDGLAEAIAAGDARVKADGRK